MALCTTLVELGGGKYDFWVDENVDQSKHSTLLVVTATFVAILHVAGVLCEYVVYE